MRLRKQRICLFHFPREGHLFWHFPLEELVEAIQRRTAFFEKKLITASYIWTCLFRIHIFSFRTYICKRLASFSKFLAKKRMLLAKKLIQEFSHSLMYVGQAAKLYVCPVTSHPDVRSKALELYVRSMTPELCVDSTFFTSRCVFQGSLTLHKFPIFTSWRTFEDIKSFIFFGQLLVFIYVR